MRVGQKENAKSSVAEKFGFAATHIRSIKDIVDDKHCHQRGFMASSMIHDGPVL
jgi:hypothetical protein